MSLARVCEQLRPHIVYLFGSGSEKLKKLIVESLLKKTATKPEYGDLKDPQVLYVSLERITFSREFVAVDFEYKDMAQATIYLSIKEVDEHCYIA